MSKTRSIFEDVSGETPQERPTPTPVQPKEAPRGAIRLWLAVLFLMVVVMILVGGLTRLTDSGLSITEWRPVTGAVPPMSAEAWDAEFEKYRSIPEYQLQNKGMSLAEFKVIYWWEWGHRQLGRVIGLVWAVGFVYFMATRAVPRGWTVRLLLLGVLGGLQGAVGWWMVSSGLEGRMVDVASYRLAIHLGLAFAILGCIGWYIFSLARTEMDLFQARRRKEASLVAPANVLMVLTFGQILLGALVAGLDAGRGYIDWPLMGGQIFPSGAFADSPWIANFFENEALTQFNHRLFGYALVGVAVWAFMTARKSGLTQIRRMFLWAKVAIILQAVWGIVTVMNAAPLSIAITHQFGAILVWLLVLRARFEVYYPGAQSLRD